MSFSPNLNEINLQLALQFCCPRSLLAISLFFITFLFSRGLERRGFTRETSFSRSTHNQSPAISRVKRFIRYVSLGNWRARPQKLLHYTLPPRHSSSAPGVDPGLQPDRSSRGLTLLRFVFRCRRAVRAHRNRQASVLAVRQVAEGSLDTA